MPTRVLIILSIACSLLLTASCGPTQKVQRTLALNQLSLKARTAAANGDDQQALAHWQEYVDRRPHSHFAQYNLGMTEARLGMYISAIQHLTTAHDLRPGEVQYIESLADTYYAAGQTEDMMTLLQETSNEGMGVDGHLRLARYAQQAGLLDDAKAAIRSAMIFDKGESAAPYMAMADFAQQINDRDLELQSLRQALWFDRSSNDLDQRFLALGVTPGPSLAMAPEKIGN